MSLSPQIRLVGLFISTNACCKHLLQLIFIHVFLETGAYPPDLSYIVSARNGGEVGGYVVRSIIFRTSYL